MMQHDPRPSLGVRILGGLATLVTVIVMLTLYLFGAASAYASMVLTVPLLLAILFVPGWRSEIAGTMTFAAFWILTIVFTINNRPGSDDYVSAINFIFLMLMGLLVVAMSSGARLSNSVLVARLAGLATLIALGWSIALVFYFHLAPDRVSGMFANRIQSAGAATIFAFLSCIGLVADKSRWRWLYAVPVLLVLVVVWLGASRGPLLEFAILALFTALFFARRKILALTGLAGLFAIGTASLLLFPKAFGRIGRLPEIIANALAGAHSDDNSGNIRLDLYRDGISAFLRSPLIGHGWRGKAIATHPGATYSRGLLEHWHLHSDVLDFAVSGGLVGLLAYALVIAAPIVGAVTSEHDSQRRARILGTSILSVGILSYGLFNAAFGFEYFTMIYVTMTAVLLGFCRDRPMFGRTM